MTAGRGYVGESWTGWLFGALQSMGYDMSRLSRGLPGINAAKTPGRLEIGSARRLYHRLDREARDPLLGYRLSLLLDEGATGFLSPLLWQSPTLGDILNNIARYQWTLSENGGFSGRRDEDPVSGQPIYVFEYVPVENAITANRHQMLLLIATTVQIIRRIMRGRCDARWLELPGTLDHRKIEDALTCESRPGSANLSIVFAAESLQMPVPIRDPALYELVRAYADKIAKSHTRKTDLITKIKHHVRQNGYARANIIQIEASTGIHRRSLQRILELDDLSFRAVKQEVIRDEAIRQLAISGGSVTETARALGYSEPSAFHRAFVKWFDVTPSEFLSSEMQ